MSRGLFRVVSFEELSEISNNDSEMNTEIGKSTRLSITNMEEEVERIIQTTELNIKTATKEFYQLHVAIDSLHRDDYECTIKIVSNCKVQLKILEQKRIDLMDVMNRIGQMKQSVEMIISSYKEASQTQCQERRCEIMQHQIKFLRKAVALDKQQVKLCTITENVCPS